MKKPEATNTPTELVPTDKFEVLSELLKNSSGRVIIWCMYINTANLLADRLRKLYPCYVYHGEQSDKENEGSLAGFIADEYGIFIATIKKAGKGLNLQCCDTAIFYEYGFVPSMHEQAEDRIYRIGQTNPVTIYYLYGKDTIEESLIRLNKAKKSLADIVVEGKKYSPAQIKRLVAALKL